MKYVIIFFLIFLAVYTLYHTARMRRLIRLGEVVAEASIPYEQAPNNSTMRILFVGDSTAVGTGASTPERSLAGLVGQKYPNAQIDNIAVNGAKLSDAIAQLKSVTSSYDLLFLHIGGNDIVRLTPLNKFRSEYKELLSLATGKATKVLHTSTGNVGSAPFFPRLPGYYFSHRTRQVIDIIQSEISDYDALDVRYNYMYTSLANDPFLADKDHFYLKDYFHPSDDGYALWWSQMQVELEFLNS
jgi:lysophospholipase L1-like esterase